LIENIISLRQIRKPMKNKNIILLLALLCLGLTLDAQTKEKSKSGFSFGAVPAIAYDSDLGFRYGALANFYDYGDGTIYPFYKHSLYVEWSHTTKGSDMKQLKYDSEYLIPGIRLTADARLETEQGMDFFGFNGYETEFNPAFITVGDPDYISKMYYRMDRRNFRLRANFQGKIIGRKLRWFAGAMHYNLKLDSVGLAKLNKGKDLDKQLPKVDGLYDKFVSQGVIPASEAKGGGVTFLSAGIVADTRDNEPNPNKGIWSEAMLLTAPGFLWNDSPFTTVVLTHRQYFTILKDKLTFAYRLNYQSTISGQIPWYMMNFTYSTYDNNEGLGGSKTLRGVMRNRVVGEGYALGNFELRWKFAKFNLLKQNFYLALSPFVDAGLITKPYKPAEGWNIPDAFYGEKDGIHLSYGAGLHIALNQNFIVAVDYGIPVKKADSNKNGLYIGLNFLF